MEWTNIFGGLMAVMMAIGILLALRKRKKEGPEKVGQLLQHFQKIKIKASLAEKSISEGKIGVGRAWGRKSEGIIQIEEKNIDYINVVSVASQYGVNYSLDYLVRTPSWSGERKRKRTRMVGKKSSGIRGKIADIEWKGDDYLSRELNFDYQLKDMLSQTKSEGIKGGIVIFPDPKYEYARVRTACLLPSPDLFEAIDIIAKHIKSGW